MKSEVQAVAPTKSKGERRFFARDDSTQREYETIYILRPNIDAAEGERVAKRVSELTERFSGTLLKVDNWGRRRLAYLIGKHSRGHFIYLRYLGPGALVSELERNFRMLDSVLRYQTIKLRDEVDLTQVQVNPEEITFAPIEAITEDDEPGLAERLGMSPSRSRNFRDDSSDDDDGDDGDGDGDDTPDLRASSSTNDAATGEGDSTPEKSKATEEDKS